MQQRLLAPEPVSARAHRAKRLSFGFGRRFFFITLLGLLWAIPAFWDVRFLLVMAAWDACAVIAWAIDLARLPRADRLVIERSLVRERLGHRTKVSVLAEPGRIPCALAGPRSASIFWQRYCVGLQ